jgi:glycosyltransferase involved in cell wall biosynthesis
MTEHLKETRVRRLNMAATPEQRIRRVMYVERTAWLGGSAVSLDGLLKGLDALSYRPLIFTWPSNSFIRKWEGIGEVILEDIAPSTQRVRESRKVAAKIGRMSPSAGRSYLTIRDCLKFVSRDLMAARRFARTIADRRIDLIHNNNGLPLDRATVLAGWLAGVSQVCHFRAFTPLSSIDRWLAGKAQAHICVSQAVKSFLIREGIPDSNLHVVHNPIDLEAFADPGDVAKTRQDLGLASSDLVIANVGRLDWWKGHDLFIKAIGELRKRWPNLRAVIVGDCGPTRRSADYSEQLRKTVAQLGLQQAVVFAGLRLDIPSVMAASDVLVHSATEPEPLGRVIMEGMAAGRPVIATAAGGVKEIIQDRETGLLVPPGSTDAIVDAIELLLHDPLLRARISQKAHACAEEHFSVQNHWDSVRRIYQLVAEGPDSRSSAHGGSEAPPERARKQGTLQ